MTEPIIVFLSSNDEFAPFAATTVTSIMEHTSAFVKFYVADCGISEEHKQTLARLSERYPCEMEFVSFDVEAAFRNFAEGRFTKAAYGRFVLPELLPHVKRAIYTDVDVAFVGDIRELWNEPLEGHTIGAPVCLPNGIEHFYDHFRLSYGLDPGHFYFASGLLLIDCEKWRENGITQQLLEICEREFVLDQEALNILFDRNRYQPLSIKYCMTYDGILNAACSQEEIDHLRKDQVIVHYWGDARRKAWTNHRLWSGRYFWETAQKTEFYEEILEQHQIQTLDALIEKAEQYERVLIYGAGEIGTLTARALLSAGLCDRVVGFLVSGKSWRKRKESGRPTGMRIDGMLLPIQEISADAANGQTLIIAAVSDLWMREVKESIRQFGFRHVVYMSPLLEKELKADKFRLAREVETLSEQVRSLREELQSLYAMLNRSEEPFAGRLAQARKARSLMMDVFHTICQQQTLSYWLDRGTLRDVSARHNGIVLEDDTIDTAMMREDYDRAAAVLREYLEPWGLEVRNGVGAEEQILEAGLKGCPALLQIRPYDYAETDLREPGAREALREKLRLCHEAFSMRYEFNRGHAKGPRAAISRERIAAIRREVLGDCDPARRRSIHSGVEAFRGTEPDVFAAEDVFPLRLLPWEEGEAFAPNHAERYLEGMYGGAPCEAVPVSRRAEMTKLDFAREAELLSKVKESLERS